MLGFLIALVSYGMNSELNSIFSSNRTPRHVSNYPPKVRTGLGGERLDPWGWLEDQKLPDTQAFLEAENSYFNSVLKAFSTKQDELYEEFKSRIKQTDLSVPVTKGPWSYYSRTEENKDYAIHCRIPATGGDEQVILDENALAVGLDYLSVGTSSVSPNHELLAYGVDLDGSERHRLYIVRIETGELLDEIIENTYYGLTWSNDSTTVYYVRPDDKMRPWQVFSHRLGTVPDMDRMIFEEVDDRYFVDVSKTKDESYITIDTSSKTTTETWLFPADEPDAEPKLFRQRVEGVEYYLDRHLTLGFVIITNDVREDFRVALADSGDSDWRDLLSFEIGTKVEAVDIFENHLALLVRRAGLTSIDIFDIDSGELRSVPKPDDVSTIYPTANPEYHSSKLRFEYTSMVTPRSVLELDMVSFESVVLKETEILGGYDPTRYETFRTWAKASDGTDVPISVVRERTNTKPAPTLLYGYGSYEFSLDPTFSTLRLSLLDRGFVYAIAHVRGGGELGRAWYRDGKLARKMNTFTDFIACANHLVATGISDRERLCARGGSAGGMLMGAVANLAPEKFNTILAEVPFVDCLNTISDPDLPLTVTEWEEWGNPLQSREIYELMASYTPYENVTNVTYPNLIVTAGLNDPRVSYFEPAKWVAKLRDISPHSNVMLRCDMGFGHSGPSGRYDAWLEEAGFFALLLAAVTEAGTL